VVGPVTYAVDLDAREQHLVAVRMMVPADAAAAGGRLVVATWTPGSYVVRDYVHHLQRMVARDAAGDVLPLEQTGVSAWSVPPLDGPLTVDLEWYANDLGVRTNHVDDRHALLVGAATFPAFEPARHRPHHVTIVGAEEVVSLLPGAGAGPYVADDHAHLVDAAFEVGPHRTAAVDVRGVEHRVVWAGHGAGVDVDRMAADLGRLAGAAVDLFGGDLPTERYTVIAVEGQGGGLEHRDGCVISIPPHADGDLVRRRRLLGLLSHEHLHLWNVRRLIPAALVDPPLDVPVLTPSLWIAEGWTSYYDRLLPARAGVWDVADLLAGLDTVRDAVDRTPGADLQSLRDASRTAWTKHYRRDENTPNAGTDYYGHGALVAFELDLHLRRRDPEGPGLDAVLRDLWVRHGREPEDRRRGFTEDDVLAALARAGGDELAHRCEALVDRPGRPDVAPLLDVVGLTLREDGPADVPDLGLIVGADQGGIAVRTALRGGAAWRAGVSGGDRLLALDGETLTAEDLTPFLRARGAGATVVATLARGARLIERRIVLDLPRPRLRLATDPGATAGACRAFTAWCGLEHPARTAAAAQDATSTSPSPRTKAPGTAGTT
jgi:predicted metalloprotease with PDZ domain